ncbi:hypothetical protein [Actinomadura macrotermitis]|uniref:hypothetical protein n=1 Tax=Actinomadura macrotermitis TaxID=2585200 RepID=UPI001297DFD2|nr:hypothetical protein [Actinomadura macrotermitis]
MSWQAAGAGLGASGGGAAGDLFTAVEGNVRELVASPWWQGASPQDRAAHIAARMLWGAGEWWLFGAWGRWYRCGLDGSWHPCPPPADPAGRAAAQPAPRGAGTPPVPPQLYPTGPDLAAGRMASTGFLGPLPDTAVVARISQALTTALAVNPAQFAQQDPMFQAGTPSTVAAAWGALLWCAGSPVALTEHPLIESFTYYLTTPAERLHWMMPPDFSTLAGYYFSRLGAGDGAGAAHLARVMYEVASGLQGDARFRPGADALAAVTGMSLRYVQQDLATARYGPAAILQEWRRRCPPEFATPMVRDTAPGEYLRLALYDLQQIVAGLSGPAAPAAPGAAAGRGHDRVRHAGLAVLAADLQAAPGVLPALQRWLDPDSARVLQAVLGDPAHPLRTLWPRDGRLPEALRSQDAGLLAELLATTYSIGLTWCRLAQVAPPATGFVVPQAVAAELTSPAIYSPPSTDELSAWDIISAARAHLAAERTGAPVPDEPVAPVPPAPPEPPPAVAPAPPPSAPEPPPGPQADPAAGHGPVGFGQQGFEQQGSGPEGEAGAPPRIAPPPPPPLPDEPRRQDRPAWPGQPGRPDAQGAHGFAQGAPVPPAAAGVPPAPPTAPVWPGADDVPAPPPPPPPPPASAAPVREGPVREGPGTWPGDASATQFDPGPAHTQLDRGGPSSWPGAPAVSSDLPSNLPPPPAPVSEPPPPAPAAPDPQTGPQVVQAYGIRFLCGADDIERVVTEVRRRGKWAARLRGQEVSSASVPALLLIGGPSSGQRRLARMVGRALAEVEVSSGQVRTVHAEDLRDAGPEGLRAALDEHAGHALLLDGLDELILDTSQGRAYAAALYRARLEGVSDTALLATCAPERVGELSAASPELLTDLRAVRLPDLGEARVREGLLGLLAEERRLRLAADAWEVVRRELPGLRGRGRLTGARLIEAYLDRAATRQLGRAEATQAIGSAGTLTLSGADFAGVAAELSGP